MAHENKMTLQGTLDLLILKAVSLGPLHGMGAVAHPADSARNCDSAGSLYRRSIGWSTRGDHSEWARATTIAAPVLPADARGTRRLRAERKSGIACGNYRGHFERDVKKTGPGNMEME